MLRDLNERLRHQTSGKGNASSVHGPDTNSGIDGTLKWTDRRGVEVLPFEAVPCVLKVVRAEVENVNPFIPMQDAIYIERPALLRPN